MPFIKISGLTTATAVSATNQFEINQNSTSRSATVAQVAAFARGTATDTVVLPAGTVSAPGLTFTGDTNTGIYSPAADTIAFTEGGVEAMRITASGQLGLGTTNPSAKMTIADAVEAGTRYLGNGLTSAGLFVGYNAAAYIYNDSNTPMLFGTNAAERMRITAAGLVGIGTSGPASNLDVATSGAGSAGNVVRVFNSTDGASAGAISLVKFGSTATTYGPYTANTVGVNSAFTNLLIGTETAHPSIFYTNNTERMRIDTSGNVGIGTSSPGYKLDVLGTLRSTGLANFDNAISLNTASLNYLYYTSALAFAQTGTGERMRIDANGRVGINTTGNGFHRFAVREDTNAGATALFQSSSNAAFPGLTFERTRAANTAVQSGDTLGAIQFAGYDGSTGSGRSDIISLVDGATSAGSVPTRMTFWTTPSGSLAAVERMRIDASGNVGIGTSSPSQKLVVSGGQITNTVAGASILQTAIDTANSINWQVGSDGANIYVGTQTNHALRLVTNNAERMRIDASGNVGIGTSSATARLHVAGTIQSTSGSSAAQIYSDGGAAYFASSGAFPALFLTNGSERARISSDGSFIVGKTSANLALEGAYILSSGVGIFTAKSDRPLGVNRLTSDGTLVSFWQDGTEEGNISVSGTTVSYNGGHLARWSQLPTKQRDPALLKGTVLSNLDEMCEWLDDEGNPLPNEQLNRMKISDVEGDPNVAGVFVNWDNDDQANSYDMNIAMTGDMIIRIAQGIAVQKGMLLISAGDGTAKPQGDDIVRSKTIAKVTSNHVTCTYPDGSYCVPCVLMAC